MAGVPFKVCVPSRKLQVGVVAKSYDHFLEVVQDKFGFVKDRFQLFLDDGTLICDQEYFELLEPQTKLTVSETRTEKLSDVVGEKRPLVIAPADSASSSPPPKRPKPVMNSNSNNNSSSQVAELASRLKIASVVGSVSMRLSPRDPGPHASPPMPAVTSPLHGVTRNFQQPTQYAPPPVNTSPTLQRSQGVPVPHITSPTLQRSQGVPVPHITSPTLQRSQGVPVPHITSPHAATCTFQPHSQYVYAPDPRQQFYNLPPMRYYGEPPVEPVRLRPATHFLFPTDQAMYPAPHAQMSVPTLRPLSPPTNYTIGPQRSHIPVAQPAQITLRDPPSYAHATYQYQLYHQQQQQQRQQQQQQQQHRLHQVQLLRKQQQMQATAAPTALLQQPSPRLSHCAPPRNILTSHPRNILTSQPRNVLSSQRTPSQQQRHLRLSPTNVQPSMASSVIPPLELAPLPDWARVPDQEQQVEIVPSTCASGTQTCSPVSTTPVQSGVVCISVVNCNEIEKSGEETEDEDGGLSIVENSSSTGRSTPTTPSSRSSSPAFFAPVRSKTSPRPSSLTLPNTLNESRGQSAADAILIDDQSGEKSEECAEKLTNLEQDGDPQPRDCSPDDGYCSSSPPASATKLSGKLPFADFDLLQPSTRTSLTQEEQEFFVSKEPRAETVVSGDAKTCEETDLQKAETELFTFAKTKIPITPTKPLPPPAQLMVRIPVKQKNGRVVCKEDASDLTISIPVTFTCNGRMVCQGLQESTEEEEVDVDVMLYPPVSPTRLPPDTPALVAELGCQHEQGHTEQGTQKETVEMEKPVTVQEYAAEELVCTLTHICTEAILRECVEEIIDFAEKAREERGAVEVKANEYLPLVSDEFHLSLEEMSSEDEEDVVIMAVEGDVVNEITVAEGEVDEELSPVDLIKKDMELNSCKERLQDTDNEHTVHKAFFPALIPDTRPVNNDQSKISERVEKILCLAEQLSKEDSKVITDFFLGGSSIQISKGVECFVLKKMDDRQVNLELNHQTGEWRGYISAQD